MANSIFVFDRHAHLLSQNDYPCIVPAADVRQQTNFYYLQLLYKS